MRIFFNFARNFITSRIGGNLVFYNSISTVMEKKCGPHLFINSVRENMNGVNRKNIIKLTKNPESIKSCLEKSGCDVGSNYLYSEFLKYFVLYGNSSFVISNYISGNNSLNYLVKNFIFFLFKLRIFLDPIQTLDSFKKHNYLSDLYVRNELSSLDQKEKINLLGFGLGDGSYEKGIAQFLIEKKITKKVNIFGFDPYAAIKSEGIEYLNFSNINRFQEEIDLVIARWVLHHVSIVSSKCGRWNDFISCINRCTTPGAIALIIEHGFLDASASFSLEEIRLYYAFNAMFDILANIGLRPHYFTQTFPNLGANFYIDYLSNNDLFQIKQSVLKNMDVVNIGPGFPNQTVIKLSK